MKNLIAVLMCALLLGCLIPTAHSVSAADPLFITGRAVNGGEIPLSDVNVSASNTSTGLTYYSVTNNTGVFNISLPSGLYNITATKANYSSNVTYHDIVVGTNGLTSFDFIMNEILGRVSGFITSGNASVGGVEITLSNAQQSFNSKSQLPFGQYSIDGVNPGVYVAKAEKTGYWTPMPRIR